MKSFLFVILFHKIKPMKRTSILFFGFLLLFITHHAAAQNCCNDPNKVFADMGNSAEFRGEHEIPAEINFVPQQGHMIKFNTPVGPQANAFLIEADTPTDNWLIVIHEWWGLNDHIKQESEKLWKDVGNVNVLALDMYDGNVADNREDASSFMQGLTNERAFSIINGMMNYIGKDAKLVTIGWCFGGGWSLQTAIEGGKQTIGCVMYYGMPDEDISRLKLLNSDVLGIFAAEESWINPEVVATFEENMEKAGKQLEVHSYAADHAFANPSSERYKEKPAQDAYRVTLDYLKGKFN
jgi:carboxymethylenebutenolidase